MSYTVTKTIKLTAKENQVILTRGTVDAGWICLTALDSDPVYIPPELLRPIAEALLELTQ